MMKTSTIFIALAIVFLIGCLAFYNFRIKHIYDTGEYRSRFKNMEFTSVKGVDRVKVINKNILDVQVEYGEKEGIWLNSKVKEAVKFEVKGDVLEVKVSDAGLRDKVTAGMGQIIVMVKGLKSVSSTPYVVDGAKVGVVGVSGVRLSGFNAKGLDLEVAEGVGFYLDKMDVGTLNAKVGDEKNGLGELVLASGVKVGAAYFRVLGASKLTLLDPKIVKSSYDVSEKANVTLNGEVLKMLQ